MVPSLPMAGCETPLVRVRTFHLRCGPEAEAGGCPEFFLQEETEKPTARRVAQRIARRSREFRYGTDVAISVSHEDRSRVQRSVGLAPTSWRRARVKGLRLRGCGPACG